MGGPGSGRPKNKKPTAKALGNAPKHLADDEREVWSQLKKIASDRLLMADTFIAEAFCVAIVRWRRCVREEREANGSAAVYKHSIIVQTAWKQLECALSKLCLSPSDRRKLLGNSAPVPEPKETNAIDAFWSGRN